MVVDLAAEDTELEEVVEVAAADFCQEYTLGVSFSSSFTSTLRLITGDGLFFVSFSS